MSYTNVSIKAVRTREKLQDKILKKELITDQELREYTQEAFGLKWKTENYTEHEKNEFDEGVLEKMIELTLKNGKSRTITDEEIIEIQEEVEHEAMVEKFAKLIGGKVVK